MHLIFHNLYHKNVFFKNYTELLLEINLPLNKIKSNFSHKKVHKGVDKFVQVLKNHK